MLPIRCFTLIQSEVTPENELLRKKIKSFSSPLIRLNREATWLRHMSHQHVGNEAIR
jgi:hypothetical protein